MTNVVCVKMQMQRKNRGEWRALVRRRRAMLSMMGAVVSFGAGYLRDNDARAATSGRRRGDGDGDRRSGSDTSGALQSLPPFGLGLESTDELELRAERNFSKRNFREAEREFSLLIAREPIPRFYEARGEVRVDAKLFDDAIQDYGMALQLLQDEDGERGDAGARGEKRRLRARSNGRSTQIDIARVLCGRALAYEGLSKWSDALRDYDDAIARAASTGLEADPFILNSRGNVKASMERWSDARSDYLASAEGFRAAKGFRDKDGRSGRRTDGEIFAASNAALMLAQDGSDKQALREMRNVARKAPNSVDIHAALAAMYWAAQMEEEAEDEWEFACERISVGCAAYRDSDWVSRIRRWPPTMALRLSNFLKVSEVKS